MKKKNGASVRRAAALYIVLALIAAATLILQIYTIAEYTKSSRAKRVVATYRSEGVMFSSNYLAVNASLDTVSASTPAGTRRIVYTGSATSDVTASVTVCNYAQSDPLKVYDRDVTYSMTAKLVKITGDTKTLATAAEVGELTVTIEYGTHTGASAVVLNSSNLTRDLGESTLDHSTADTDVYKVTFSSGFNTDTTGIYLYLLANPTSRYPGVSPLDAVFRTAVSDELTSNAWTGKFNEAGALASTDPDDADDFDGFRYVIEGTGRGTCKLSWDSSKIEINQLFILYNGLTHNGDPATVANGSGTTKYIVFDVDSDVKNRYDTQFYYADDVYGTITSWETLKGYATLEYT